ncbi:MAG: 6-phosphogluconolactonase [Marinobacter sp.]|nr:6-phosphogluconolactonase [Marinobacter sp.]
MKMPELALPEGVEMVRRETPDETARSLAEAVAGELRQRLANAETASLVVSGGSTPVPFFDHLSRAELDWSRVTVLLADERWVPENDPASNARLVRTHLLQNRAQGAGFLPLKTAASDPQQALPHIERRLAELELPLDVLVLGMGNDGHTASLFPDAPELPLALKPCRGQRAALMTPPSQIHTRFTLTLPVLQSARFIALHLKGADKLDTLASAAANPDDWQSMPIRAFLRPGLTIYWSP